MKSHSKQTLSSGAPERQRYRPGTAAAFVDARLAEGRACLSLDALVDETKLDRSAALKQLRRLAPKVVPVYPRSEIFLIVPPEHRLNGAPPVLWWIDEFLAWHGEPYYLGLMSAAAQYGSSHQVLQTTQIITSRPRDDIEIGRLRVSFIMKKTVSQTPTSILRGGYAPVRVSSPEATVFDLIRYARQVGGMERVVVVIDEMRSHLSAAGFRRALEESHETTLLQRGGFVLEKLGMGKFSDLVRHRLGRRRLYPTPIGGPDDEGRKDEWRENAWRVYGAMTFGGNS